MTLARKEIREAVAAAIIAAGTPVGDRVFENRVDPFQHRHLPAASVYTLSEDVSVLADGPRLYARRCELVVQIFVDGNDSVDDRCDEIGQAIENAIEQSGLVEDCAPLARLELSTVRGPVLGEEGRLVIAAINLTYTASYETEFAADPSELDDLEQVGVEVDTHEPRDGAESAEVIELETT